MGFLRRDHDPDRALAAAIGKRGLPARARIESGGEAGEGDRDGVDALQDGRRPARGSRGPGPPLTPGRPAGMTTGRVPQPAPYHRVAAVPSSISRSRDVYPAK